MADRTILSLDTVPVDIIYKILDNLSVVNIISSMRNVCMRLNTIIDSYQRYPVNIFPNITYLSI